MTPLPPPDSGALLQQNQPAPIVVPSSDNTGLGLQLKPTPGLLTSAPFLVNKIEIVGNTVFSTATLHALVENMEGHEQTLQKLNAAVSHITEYYNSRGYPLAQSYIPAQTMRDGTVRVSVVEARYGQIILTNHSLANDEIVRSTLKNLKSGHQVQQPELDRTLLLLGDIPGVIASSHIKPGAGFSTSDLMIDAEAAPWWNGYAVLDNYGNRYTGRGRLGGTFNWVDPLHLGDLLTFNTITTGKAMDSLSLSYEIQLNGEGTRAGGSVSALHYVLGDSLANIGGHGTAEVASLWVKYPWLRTRNVNVTGQFQLDTKKLNDAIDTGAIATDRHISSGSASLTGELRDDTLAGAVTTWSVTWKVGQLHFDNFKALAVDANAGHTEGHFTKWTASFDRVQNLSANSVAFGALSAQYSTRNLDSAEKMVAGGAYSVRAYDMGAVSADAAVLANIEFRQSLPLPENFGQFQTVVFADGERVSVNHTTWANGINSCNLIGAGIGLNWANNIGWHAKLFWAWPVGAEPVLISAGRQARIWVEMGAWF